jgi:hypothetical protein
MRFEFSENAGHRGAGFLVKPFTIAEDQVGISRLYSFDLGTSDTGMAPWLKTIVVIEQDATHVFPRRLHLRQN